MVITEHSGKKKILYSFTRDFEKSNAMDSLMFKLLFEPDNKT